MLVSEGFASVEEVAYVDSGEVANIEGFDEDTAQEIQARARDFLERRETERDAKRKELGVLDEVVEVPGVTSAMLVAFGENEVKTVEDLAGCATDDLLGWYERKDGESVREKGILEGFKMSKEEAEDMIMSARVVAGWISVEDAVGTGEEEAEAEAEQPGADASATSG